MRALRIVGAVLLTALFFAGATGAAAAVINRAVADPGGSVILGISYTAAAALCIVVLGVAWVEALTPATYRR